MVTNGNLNGNKMVTCVSCETCGRVYKYKSGLSRHKKLCVGNNESVVLKTTNVKVAKVAMDGNDAVAINLLVGALSKQGDLIEKLIENQKEMIPKMGNNNNNKISINVFLNEHCKNAMNLTDFVDNIKVSIQDLEYTNQHGYAKGISNLFTKHLTDMAVTERPIHCSDKKRLQFYIKDSDKWEKDITHKKLDKTIDDIASRQFWHLKEWEKENPDHVVDEKKGQIWLQMMKNLSGCLASNKTTNIIKKNISENVTVKELINTDPQTI
ncbi:MAG: hypothetical protein ACTSQ5_14220 [Promethearchaeota archaeon]|jgi:hypothetical protein